MIHFDGFFYIADFLDQQFTSAYYVYIAPGAKDTFFVTFAVLAFFAGFTSIGSSSIFSTATFAVLAFAVLAFAVLAFAVLAFFAGFTTIGSSSISCTSAAFTATASS